MHKDKSSINSKTLILILLIIVTVYGIMARMSVHANTEVIDPIRSDAREYFAYAGNISEFCVYSHLQSDDGFAPEKTSKRPPGFPFFASFFYTGDVDTSVNSVLVAQTIVQCLALVLFSILCWHFTGPLFTLIVSLLVWTHPAFMSVNTYFLTESLFLSSLIAVLISFTMLIRSEKRNRIIFFSLILGTSAALSSLTRSTMEYYLLFILAVIFFQSRKTLSKLWPALIIFFVIIGAWKLRNYYAIGSFSDPHLMINGIFHGSYPYFKYNNIYYAETYRLDPLQNEYYKGIGTTLKLIFDRASENPWHYISWYTVGKQFFLWQWEIIAGMGDVFIFHITDSPILYQTDLRFWHSFHKSSNLFFMITGVLYSYYILISGMLKKHAISLISVVSGIVVYASLFHVIVAPYPRYGIPFKPFVIMMSLFFLANSFHKIKTMRVKQ